MTFQGQPLALKKNRFESFISANRRGDDWRALCCLRHHHLLARPLSPPCSQPGPVVSFQTNYNLNEPQCSWAALAQMNLLGQQNSDEKKQGSVKSAPPAKSTSVPNRNARNTGTMAGKKLAVHVFTKNWKVGRN